MSSTAQAWAWRMIRAGHCPTATCSLVLIRLADRADTEGICWPGHECTARDLSVSERSVRQSITWLQANRLLEVEARFDSKGRQQSNRYRLALEAIAEPEQGVEQQEKHVPPPKAVRDLAERLRRETRGVGK